MMRLARRKLADGQLPGIGDVIMAAAQHLERVRSAHRGAVESELGALRTEIIAMPGGAPALGPAVLSLRLAAGPPSTPPAASAPPAAAPSARGLTEDEQASLSRARGRTIAARSAIESRRFDAAGPALEEALAQLARVPEASSAELRREVEVLRGQLADELRAQDRRKVMDDVERHLRSAESDAEYQHVGTGQEAVQRALRRLEEPDVARMLSPEQVAGYRDRAAALGDMFSATLRSDALARAKPMLEELERAAPEDMFAGMEEYELLRKDRALVTMRVRVLTALRNSAIDDPDIAAIVRRLVAVERRIAAALTTWSTVRRDERVVNDWAAVSRNTSGWTQEAISSGDDPEMLEEPELPKTRFALSRARAQSAYTPRRVGTESDGLPASGEDATATLDPRDMIDHMYRAASTKLAASYIRLLDAAERMAPPLDQFLLRRPAQIAYNAARTLAGTSHRDAIVARAESIDERWRAAYMTATHGTHELYEKLNREADRKWPELRDSSNALPFDLDRTQPGTLIFLERVINRAGWDYHARGVELAVRVDNALVAGVCSPHVKMALQHAVRVQRLDIGDRVPWNVIGIVRNMGMLDVRTHLTLRDHQSGKAVGEEHTWTSTECVNITIIGLQVGPVIVFDMAAANG